MSRSQPVPIETAYGLVVESTTTGMTRVIVRNGHIVYQTLTVSHETPVAVALSVAIEAYVARQADAVPRDPVLRELAHAEALTSVEPDELVYTELRAALEAQSQPEEGC